MCLLSLVLFSVTPRTIACRLLCPWDFPGRNTGVGCDFLLQGIFLTQGSNSQLLWIMQWQMDSLLLHHLRILAHKEAFSNRWFRDFTLVGANMLRATLSSTTRKQNCFRSYYRPDTTSSLPKGTHSCAVMRRTGYQLEK